MDSPAPPAAILTTERLRLRRVAADDAGLLTELDSDPAVMRFINGGRVTPLHEIEGELLPAWLAYRAATGYGYWLAFAGAGDVFMGWFGLRPHDGRPHEPELGYRLRAAVWGLGYATEGSRALVDHAFRDLGAERVWAQAMAVNAASRRVMEKAGLHYVRTFHVEWPERIEGSEHGDVEYALTRAEWAQVT